ncbi:MAG: hypothetical protein ACE5D6_08075 [Candidatus Zixiibacteriota bacterium]
MAQTSQPLTHQTNTSAKLQELMGDYSYELDVLRLMCFGLSKDWEMPFHVQANRLVDKFERIVAFIEEPMSH